MPDYLPDSSVPWAINPAALPLRSIIPPKSEDDDGATDGDTAAASSFAAIAGSEAVPSSGGVAVVALAGIVDEAAPRWAQRAGWATAPSVFAGAVEAAAHAAGSVLIVANSPGGSTAGVVEAAARVRAAARNALVVAVSSHQMCSAAYFLCSGAGVLAASPSAYSGSVGVISTVASRAALNEDLGFDVRVLSAGAGKADLHPDLPLDAEALGRMEALVAAAYGQFVAHVAGARGVPRSRVRDGWGAHVLPADAAKDAGMVDAVMSAADMHRMLSSPSGRRAVGKLAAMREVLRGDARMTAMADSAMMTEDGETKLKGFSR